MANFKETYKLLQQAEFSSNPTKFLHLNAGEIGYTLGGLYRKYNEHNIDWFFVQQVIDACNGDLERASQMLYIDEKTQTQVIKAFKFEYWDKARLDEVESQIIASNIFIFGTNVGMENAIKEAQRVVGVLDDGIIGIKTLSALNSFNEDTFKDHFDTREKAYYQGIRNAKPHKFARYEDGQNFRALMV